VGHASGPNQTRFDLRPNPQFERLFTVDNHFQTAP
jgi:hypothetical protein